MKKARSAVKIVFMSLGIAIVAFLFFVVATLAVDKFIKKSPVPSFFGYSTLIVTTGSMSGTIEQGDMIVIKKTDEYKIGDVITFIPEGESIPTTHRIIRISGDHYYTKGDANNAEDMRPVTADRIVGKVINTYSHAGLFFGWLKDDFGWAYIVLAVAIVIAGVLLLKYVSFSKNKETESVAKEPAKAEDEPREKENE